MKAFLAIGALAALLALPSAMAYIGTNELTDALAPVTEMTPVPMDAFPDYYVTESGDVWQESNAFDGLQTEPVVDENGEQLGPADTFVVGASILPALPSV